MKNPKFSSFRFSSTLCYLSFSFSFSNSTNSWPIAVYMVVLFKNSVLVYRSRIYLFIVTKLAVRDPCCCWDESLVESIGRQSVSNWIAGVKTGPGQTACCWSYHGGFQVLQLLNLTFFANCFLISRLVFFQTCFKVFAGTKKVTENGHTSPC